MPVTLEELADRIESIERRLVSLEQGVRYQPPPPPVKLPDAVPLATQLTGPHYPPPGRVAAEEDAEYFLGAKVLPRVGASVLVLGLGYLVSLAVSRGILGPWSLFGFACLICLGFVAVGQWHRNTREQFGELLTGVGSCGLYMTFAGGHAYQHLYGGEVLVGLFLGLSALNFAYSLWRASTSFLAIGVVGGFGAALMPLRDHAFALTAVLEATILVVAAGVAARHRWSEALAGVTLSATLAALPLAHGWTDSTWYGVGLVYLVALVGLVGWSRIRPEDEAGLPATAGGGLLFLSAVLAYAAKHGLPGTYHVLAATSCLALVGLFLNRRPEVRGAIGFGAALAAILLAPLGLPAIGSLMTYPVLAFVGAALAVKYGRAVATLAGIAAGAAIARYSVLLATQSLPLATEISFLLLVVLAAVAVGLAYREPDAEAGGLGIAVLILSRLEYLVATPWLGLTPNEAVTAVLIVTSLLFLALGFLRDHSTLRYASFFGLAMTVFKVLIVDLATMEPAVRVMILMALGLVMVGGGYGYIRHQRRKEKLATEAR